MPFNAYTSYDNIRVSLNRQMIIHLLQYHYDKYPKDIWTEAEKRYFDLFIKFVEKQYSIYLEDETNEYYFKIFKEWFYDSYNEGDFNNFPYLYKIENLFEEDN
tara:strand:+ start:593 stop:901 length:309 start_codon:yes stop_codon:yes gene_type:complete